MAQQSMMSYELHGAQEIARKLGKLKGPIRPMVMRVIMRGKNTAKAESKPHPGDTGAVARTIRSRVSPGEMPAEGRVFTNIPAAQRIEQGRRPGDRPSIALMKRFASRHGIPTDKAFELAEDIERHGSKPVGFMASGAEKISEALPEELAKATREIEGAFQRG